MARKKKVFVFGASGSIGQSSLDIIRNFPKCFELAGYSYHYGSDFAKKLKAEFPEALSFCTAELGKDFSMPEYGKAFSEVLKKSGAEIAVNGISGAAGLPASVCTLQNGMDLALANKESIVTAGKIIALLAKKNGARILPVDSEHWAVFQLINSHCKNIIEDGNGAEKRNLPDKIILTASGGAFRDFSSESLKKVKLADALSHPTWSMGAKITVDSASLANKALEVIEAVNLFGVSPQNIIVTVHRQSIVHSMVQLKSGEVYAQLSPPDMRNPILGALTFPKTAPSYLKPLDFSKTFTLDFEQPRYSDFPLLGLGFKAAEKQGLYPAAFNAANEEAVNAFMQEKIGFTDIARIVEEVLAEDWKNEAASIEEVFEADRKARAGARSIITKYF